MEKPLLINGCSFGKCWTPSDKFISALDCTSHVNLSKVATGFQRTCRSTVEWIAQNGNPGFVIIPITYVTRVEMPTARCDKWDDIDGNWIPVQENGMLPSDAHDPRRGIKMNVDHAQLISFYKQYHRLVHSSIGYVDKVLTEMITLGGLLESLQIPYLMFDMCNEFDEQLIYRHPHVNKVKLAIANKRIMNLFSFCGNKYMYLLKGGKAGEPFNEHHKTQEYLGLETHILEYLRSNTLIQ